MNTRMKYDGRGSGGLRVARMGTVTVPAGSGAYSITVTGLGLPSANYVVTMTPNSPNLSGICTYSYTSDGFTISVTRATGTAIAAVRWILVIV